MGLAKQPHNPLAIALVLAGLAGVTYSAGTAPAVAQDAAARGLEIATEADRRDLGWGDSATTLRMILTNREGQASERELRLQTLETDDPAAGDMSLTVFDRPRDVEGTAFLSHTKIADADDQWLFLPALKRVKRISSANKSGPFLGSEFAFEDLVSQEVEKYTYSYVGDEPCGDLTCFVIERVPLYENSGYTKQTVWMDQEEYRIIKVDYYDRKESLLKTLVMSDYQQYLGQYWRAHTLQMDNHQTGKGTTLAFDEYVFQTGLDEGDFRSNRLKRAR